MPLHRDCADGDGRYYERREYITVVCPRCGNWLDHGDGLPGDHSGICHGERSAITCYDCGTVVPVVAIHGYVHAGTRIPRETQRRKRLLPASGVKKVMEP